MDHLPSEILTSIYLVLPDVASALSLSTTCRRFRNIYHSSQELVILSRAADTELGPIEDFIQLLTHNASQLAHVHRTVPISHALIRDFTKIGRVAQRWEEIYSFKKWKDNWADRRLLNADERYQVRRAIYRLWLFARAFHLPPNRRTSRGIPAVVRKRAALLQNFPTPELAEMWDVHQVLRNTVSNDICPSNARMRQKFQQRFPDNSNPLSINIHLNYPVAPSSFVPASWLHNSTMASAKSQSRLAPSRWHEPGAEGWGDDINHYYVVEDMMKLDPGQILHLRDRCSSKEQVEAYVREKGEWFINNGETFSQTLALVVAQRGECMEDLKAGVEAGEMGVAVSED